MVIDIAQSPKTTEIATGMAGVTGGDAAPDDGSIRVFLHVHVKAKLHYASCFGAGSKLVRNQIPLSYLVRTSFEPASVMEFGREPAAGLVLVRC